MPTDNRTNIKNFGAIGDGVADDTTAIQKAVNFCIKYPALASTLRIPIGNYRITKPILLDNKGQFFTIKITGDLSNKSASEPYLSKITCDFKEGYGFGIQLGRSIEIENITILGKYQFPNQVTNSNIGTYKFKDWADAAITEGITDSRYAPYAGISIDPIGLVPGGGGTSDVTIRNCSIRGWMVGVCLTPNPDTANDEMINIIETNIESCRVAIAIGQDQSKTINIKGFKAWASVHTILDGLSYGRGTGGGSVFAENWNIAGNVNQLFNIINDRFPLSAMNIYSESIFRIGRVGGRAGANFINCQIDFLTSSGWPAADYLIFGNANWYGGCLRYYDNQPTHRMNMVCVGGMFRDMVLSTYPITQGLYGIPQNVYPVPLFNQVGYYSGGYNGDSITKIIVGGITIDRTKWQATITNITGAKIGDYILASPNGKYYDQDMNPTRCPTAQIGRIIAISGTTATLDDVGLNVFTGTLYDAIFINRLNS